MRPLACFAPGLLFAVVACTGGSEAPPRQIVVARAQPSVLQALSSFDVTLSRQSDIGLRTDADGKTLIASEYRQQKGRLLPGLTEAKFGWLRIAADPGRYLVTSGNTVSFQVTDQPCSSGTAFAVDDQGTLLTNQHVIDPVMLRANEAALASFAIDDMVELVSAIGRLLGDMPDGAVLESLEGSLVPWLQAKYTCTDVKLHEVRVATRLLPAVLTTRTLRIRPEPVPDWKKSTIVCDVLATGQVYPGKDVAVLRARPLAGKLISLPLGDARRVVNGTRVHALGFPAAAVIPGVDPDAARFRVIAHDGIVDQRLVIQGGWEAFHMTANINHGDSGGPVIDDNGDVIGITVAGSNDAAAQNLAIPIDIGKEFLARAGAQPTRNELTANWYRACDEFAHQRYAAALPLFEAVNRAQGAWLIASTGQASELIAHCKAEIAAGRGGDGFWGTVTHWADVGWDVVRQQPIHMQLLLGLLALSGLVGLLKFVRRLFG